MGKSVKNMQKIKSYYEKAASPEQAFVYMEEGSFLSPIPHFHNRFEIIYILKGQADLVCNGKEFHGIENSVFFVNKFEHHYYKNTSSDLHAYIISANDFYLKDFNIRNKTKIFPNLLDKSECNEKIRNYFENWFNKGHDDVLFNVGWMNIILGTLVENYQLFELDEKELRKFLFQSITNFIQEHYNENLTLKTVADKMGYSVAYFSVIFKETVGESFKSYLNTIRMREAMRLSQTTDKTNEKIAEEAGFNSISAFYRAKKNFKI